MLVKRVSKSLRGLAPEAADACVETENKTGFVSRDEEGLLAHFSTKPIFLYLFASQEVSHLEPVPSVGVLLNKTAFWAILSHLGNNG